jgi:hypothetical protein
MGGWRRAVVVVSGLLVAAALAPPVAAGAQEQRPRTWNAELVGHVAPPQGGGYADVWAHKDVAYLGNIRQADCRPANGVWAIDLREPARPRPLASFARFPGSDGEDVWVGAVRTTAFKGDLAAVGLQRCSRQDAGFAGLALYDVSEPARPRELGRLDRLRGAGLKAVEDLADAHVCAYVALWWWWHGPAASLVAGDDATGAIVVPLPGRR